VGYLNQTPVAQIADDTEDAVRHPAQQKHADDHRDPFGCSDIPLKQ